MSLIRGSGNKDTELRLIQVFRANGITGWRRGCSLALAPRSSKVQGLRSKDRSTGRVKPDFVFPKLSTAVFVDGCFWHGCPRHATQPKTNAAFWRKKIATNKARDRKVNRHLRAKGWTVVRVWEHELAKQNAPKLLKRLAPVARAKD
jgi:DNA mismatch endonuclease (patch repair protein)